MTTPMLLNLGLSGFALSGADVGGFSGTPQAALLTKWFELAAFEPLDRDHTARNTGDQEPWASGPAEEAIRRKFIEERYRLMPYLYTAAEEMSRTGVPIMRPLFVEFPEANKDRRPLDLDCGAEFLFGANLLVAPAPYPDELDKYEVKFPPAAWYDYWTGAKVKDDPSAPTSSGMATPVVIKPQNDVLPVYVRGGSIIPVAPLTQSTMETPRGPLTLRVYPGENCQGSLYLDDGQSFDYKRGSSLRVNFTCAKTSKSLVFHIASREGSFAPWWKELNVEVYGFDAMPRRLTVNGIPLPQSSARLDAASHILRVTLPDSGQEQRLELLF
jgi:alpha-glucosidase